MTSFDCAKRKKAYYCIKGEHSIHSNSNTVVVIVRVNLIRHPPVSMLDVPCPHHNSRKKCQRGERWSGGSPHLTGDEDPSV